MPKTHGLTRHSKFKPLYNVWEAMKQRCTNKRNKHYSNYGGRGITVCDEWINDPMEFAMFMVSSGWRGDNHLEIDRIDNDKGYFPGNVRLVEKSYNCVNRGSRAKSTSRYKGVSWNIKQGAWRAYISYEKKQIHLGYFSSEYEAAKAYNNKANELHKEFANLNRLEVNFED